MRVHDRSFTFVFTAIFAGVLGVASLPSYAHAANAKTCSGASKRQDVKTETPKSAAARIISATSIKEANVGDAANYWARFTWNLEKSGLANGMGKKHVEEVIHWVKANFFIDRQFAMESGSRETKDLPYLFDRSGEQSAYGNYSLAFDDVRWNLEQRFTKTQIKEIQRKLISRKVSCENMKACRVSFWTWITSPFKANVELTKDINVGEFRRTNVYTAVAKNPQALEQKYPNPYLKIVEQNGVKRISYPDLAFIESYKEFVTPATYKAIKGDGPAMFMLEKTRKELTFRMINDMIDDAMNRHESQLRAAKTAEARIDAHAEFTWRYISIHPFANGNGRSSRLILARLLMEDGFLPPILRSSDDIVMSLEDYKSYVREGVVISKAFIDDTAWRVENGWNPYQSPIPLTSRLPSRVYFESGQPGIGKQFADVDPYDFAQFIREKYKGKATSEATMLKDYVAHVKEWTGFRAKTAEPYQVHFIPSEMQAAVFSVDAVKPEAWHGKIDKFYSDQLTWRGLGSPQPMTVESLLNLFIKPSGILLSMHSSRATKPAQIERAVLEDFERFNKSVLNPADFFQMSADHMNAEGGYGDSPFLSTGIDKSTAARFSKGFLTSPEYIMKMRSQLIVGGLVPNFGTSYFNRLRPIGQHVGVDFMSKYPRQQEVAIAGTMAPDSVMRLEYQDVTVNEVAQNTGFNIAGVTQVNGKTILERSAKNPSIVRVSEFDGEGNQRSQKYFQISGSTRNPSFVEIQDASREFAPSEPSPLSETEAPLEDAG